LDYSLIFFTRSKNPYEYTAGSAMTYNLVEYIVSFLIRCAFEFGILFEGIKKFKLTTAYFINDKRTLHNIQRNKQKEIIINSLILMAILISLKWL